MKEYKLEKGIPISQSKRGRKGRFPELVAKAEHGDSTIVTKREYAGLRIAAMKQGVFLKFQGIDEVNARVWFLKEKV